MIRYKIYELDTEHLKERDCYSRGDENRVCFIERLLPTYGSNCFESFDVAVKYLIDNKMNYREYTILPIIYLTDYED